MKASVSRGTPRPCITNVVVESTAEKPALKVSSTKAKERIEGRRHTLKKSA